MLGTGQFKTVDALTPYLDAGVSQVVVSAPIKVPEVLNVVMGVNQALFSAEKHRIVTAPVAQQIALRLPFRSFTRRLASGMGRLRLFMTLRHKPFWMPLIKIYVERVRVAF